MSFIRLIRLTSASLGLALLLPVLAHAGFSVSGTLPQLAPGTQLQLLREDLDKRSQILEGEITVQADRSFDANFTGEPGVFSLELLNSQKIPLAIDWNQRISIATDLSTAIGYSVRGSKDTEVLHAYESFRKESLARLVYPPRAKLNQATAAGASAEQLARLAQGEVDGYSTHRRELNDFTIEKAGTSIALYATSLRWDSDYRGDELQQLVDAFAKIHPDLAITRSMQERMRIFALTAVGATASPLSGQNLEGETLSLEDLRGKVVLVDFWASWCVPCRVENRHYPDLLEKYSSHGFEVFGVNLDDSRSKNFESMGTGFQAGRCYLAADFGFTWFEIPARHCL
ncbi:MAG: TlpA disulfide reductase family protein [Verrucomicrobia bacterium]|nr:TlpA disulfide reductase family protein [Verrucomicrobiota bacterium]